MEAWADAGSTPRSTSERLGVAMASGIGGVHTLLDQLRHAQREGPAPGLPARRPDADAERARPPTSACTSAPGPACTRRSRPAPPGNEAHRARPSTRSGSAGPTSSSPAAPRRDPPAADGGVREDDGAVASATTSPSAASRPWDTGRDGFVLGEGAGVLVLESEEHAQARGATIYAEVAGAGITADAHDIAQPDPAGRGGARAMAMALREAGVDARRHRPHQRPRDLDPAGRHRRGPDDPRDARRRTPTTSSSPAPSR